MKILMQINFKLKTLFYQHKININSLKNNNKWVAY